MNQEAIAKKIGDIISEIEAQILTNNEKMSKIDEEYRKKAEDDKAALKTETAGLVEEVKYWKSTLTTRYGISVDDPDGASTVTETPTMEAKESSNTEDMTLFPKENPVEETVEEEVGNIEEVVEENQITEENDLNWDEEEEVEEEVEEEESDREGEEVEEDDSIFTTEGVEVKRPEEINWPESVPEW